MLCSPYSGSAFSIALFFRISVPIISIAIYDFPVNYFNIEIECKIYF